MSLNKECLAERERTGHNGLIKLMAIVAGQ